MGDGNMLMLDGLNSCLFVIYCCVRCHLVLLSEFHKRRN
jgi:hypothetical protein